ncbi:probable inactive leucine-rich repeat receptor-like protein kinase At3g03770 isoform X1 [Zingiber officinale]|uniref:probable inactive leucine-rich repeat receptor-like protein kinase At3g03770 isoform X1 n=1 Tax=Zingiber officinale TaxID=94328 RepID=UPI001C4C8C42|nr:probable inactive leucine-rich repeat receptor-like protein kinase At3g03770 isoform X1 [Zingiber officinale]
MASESSVTCLLSACVVLVLVPHTYQLQSSQDWSLLRIQRLLNYPSVLSSWNATTDFCNADPLPHLTVVCYEESITQLHISGSEGSPSLPRSFSIDSFFTTLARLSNLKVLSLTSLGLWGHLPAKICRLYSLEIVNMSSNYLYGTIPHEVSNLIHLQTLVLNHNMFSGQIPDALSGLSLLVVLNLQNNSLSGLIPESFSGLKSLRVLVLSSNSLSGNLPDLSSLTNLQVINLENNYLGPQFPRLGTKVVSVLLRKNGFGGGLPSDLSSFFLLEQLDISFNKFVGPFPPALLSLPSIRYLNISGNKFTGMLFENTTCNDDLQFVDLSSNLLSGNLPACLVSDSKSKMVLYSSNCLEIKDYNQHLPSFCQTQALAVGILHNKEKRRLGVKATIVMGVVLGSFGSILLAGFAVFLVIRRARAKRSMKGSQQAILEHASSIHPPKLLPDASTLSSGLQCLFGYVSQTMKLGALGIPSYRSFSVEELEYATNNFQASSFIGEDSHVQMYRGRLQDGSLVAIRCLNLKRGHNPLNFNHQIELISKLRHRYLVSTLGHCFEYYIDDSSISRLFFIFEYMMNGTLRSNISEGGQRLSWTQRISAAIGVAKGIQFLHSGIMPGLFSNNLKITDIVLDQNLVAKISSYNLPLVKENTESMCLAGSFSGGMNEPNQRPKHLDKIDIYDFGVILLEVVSGRPIALTSEVEIMKEEFEESILADGTAGRSIVDPLIRRQCCDESLKTVAEICLRCLSEEPTKRPSVEDVLWNLQFAVQVQESWRTGSSQSSANSHLLTLPHH